MSLPSLAMRTAILPPAPWRAVTLRRSGVAVILLLALAARALVRKSVSPWAEGCWARRAWGLRQVAAVAAAVVARKWRREIARGELVMRVVLAPLTIHGRRR